MIESELTRVRGVLKSLTASKWFHSLVMVAITIVVINKCLQAGDVTWSCVRDGLVANGVYLTALLSKVEGN